MLKSEEQILWEKKIAGLSEIPVYLAEFEYLYDSDPKLRGQIDPNALSAGGFPFLLFRQIMETFYSTISQTSATIVLDVDQINSVAKLLTNDFSLSRIDALDVAQKSTTLLSIMFGMRATNAHFDLYFKGLSSLKERLKVYNPPSIKRELLDKLLITEAGIGFVEPKLWPIYKTAVFEQFLDFVNAGGSFEQYSNEYLKEVIKYIEFYVDSIYSSDENGNNDTFNIYAVEWESDLSYAAKYILEKRHQNLEVRVYLDFHADTGLISTIPYSAITIVLNSIAREALYKLVIKKSTEYTDRLLVVRVKASQFPRIEVDLENNQLASLHLSETKIFPLENLKTFNNVETKDFDQYAYQFKHPRPSPINLENRSDKKMYLSCLLNAKAALFWIYANSEIEIEHPPTLIDAQRNRSNEYHNYVYGGRLVIKEGGFCSTGGSEVKIIEQKKLKDNLDFGYITNVVQPYVPSHLFQYNGKALHTHIRKASVINSKGHVSHCGYVMKACYEDQTNSSAFKTIVLTFDENKRFINGTFISRKSSNFKSLAEVGITHALEMAQFEDLLEEVKLNWLKAMFVLNDYCAGDIKEKFNNMVEQGIISSAYKLI